MRLVKNGPDIPDQLIHAHEDSRVVFFCGAGIAYPAGLPGFQKLVKLLFDALGEQASTLEENAISHHRYDLAIDLLEKRLQSRELVREKILEILKPANLENEQATATHRALLTLAKASDGQTRLVTTNFDRIFDHVGSSLKSYVAPLLPIPKKSRWDGIIYLHGLLPEKTDPIALNNLVVSSGDFGLAYLTERWASRFVTDLFANYTVCFVGYSAEDPVLRYMLDALSADQLRGEIRQQFYAFASHENGHKEDEAEGWNAKGVSPILYEHTSGHELLHESIQEWAKLYRDGLTGKSSVISREASARPSRLESDGQIERVLWAITDLSGRPARTFADLEPPPPFDWLDIFSEKRFSNHDLPRFGILDEATNTTPLSFSLVAYPTPHKNSRWSALIESHSFGPQASKLTEIQFNLARWLVKHLDNPRLLHWVIGKGGSPHPTFALMIRRQLRKQAIPIPLAKIWHLVCSGVTSNKTDINLHDFEQQYKSNGWSREWRIKLREFLRPILTFREPWQHDLFRNRNQTSQDPKHSEVPSVKDYVIPEIELAGGDQLKHSVGEFEKRPDWPERAAECLPDFTTLLEDVFVLMAELEVVTELSDLSYISRPDIGNHVQNRGFREWTLLVKLCRDAFIFACRYNPKLARAELERWKLIRVPIFRRLVLFAAANSALITKDEALNLLLEDDQGWWLWSLETKREAIRLLVNLAPKIGSQQLETICHKILEGPPRTMFIDDLLSADWIDIVDRYVWLRLAKISSSGATLPDEAKTRLESLSISNPTWKLESDQRDEFASWIESGSDTSFRRRILLPEDNESALADALLNSERDDHWQEDNWRELCQRNPHLVTKVLIRLTTQDAWPIKPWREALQVYSEGSQIQAAFQQLSPLLKSAPNDVIKQLIHSFSWWLSRTPQLLGQEPNIIWLELVDRVLDWSALEAPSYDDDPVGRAINHPLGHVAEALIRAWFVSEPKVGQGLPTFLSSRLNKLSSSSCMKLAHGRVILGSHVISLFMADEKWAKDHLLGHFNWRIDVREARGAWEGYLWSPRINPDLLEAFKDSLLDTANHYDDLGTHGGQYATLLTTVALTYDDALSANDLQTAFNALSIEGLAGSVKCLANSLSDAGSRNEEQWQNRVRPFIEKMWPKSGNKQSPKATSAFAQICIFSGKHFPSAVKLVSPFLRRTRDYDLAVLKLYESNLIATYPNEALDLLDLLIDDGNPWPPAELSQCLQHLLQADKTLADSPKFKRLSNYVTRFDRG